LVKSSQSIQGLKKQGVDAFLNELIWREFYYQILANYPHAAIESFKGKFEGLPWSCDQEHADAWRSGQTGYPIVDAAMRQLVTEGWMHNRCRMIVANFLVKDLHINWQVGEEYFMQHLADGDTALNNGGWQWCAGTGTDAQPWFRILNPVLQSKKFDPRGEYIRKYIPELTNVQDKYIHEPWLMPSPVQREAGVLIGKQYPMSIVDHERERKHTLEVFGKINNSYHHSNNHK
jgi:deoxyribodipyrimidine photo-lyase